MKVTDAARGKWKGVLIALGVDERHLNGKHGPCPWCGGQDRFRFDNKAGNGTFICSVCGAGNGFEFLKRVHGWEFKQAAPEIERVLGMVRSDPPKPQMNPEDRGRMLNEMWKGASPLTPGDMAGRYLQSRGCLPDVMPQCLRFHPRCPVPHSGGFLPAMIALVVGPDGKPVNIHRTYLGPNGKADIDTPRAMMPGPLPEGSAIRLSAVYGERLGVGEGIETALKAGMRFNVPAWATVNSTMLAKWICPEGVKEVLVFGDNDPGFGGQAATYALAHRLKVRDKIDVRPCIPLEVGCDWADEVAS